MGEDLIYIVCDLSAHRRSSQPFSEIITAINLRALACSSGLSCLPTILQQYGFQAFALLRPIIQLFVDLRNSTCPTPHVVEQIIAYGRRIVQIMIQATDLAQILYRGHPSRKKRGPRKISIWPPFSKMAAMGYPENVFFALNGQQMVGKDNNENRFYVLSIANVQIMS